MNYIKESIYTRISTIININMSEILLQNRNYQDELALNIERMFLEDMSCPGELVNEVNYQGNLVNEINAITRAVMMKYSTVFTNKYEIERRSQLANKVSIIIDGYLESIGNRLQVTCNDKKIKTIESDIKKYEDTISRANNVISEFDVILEHLSKLDSNDKINGLKLIAPLRECMKRNSDNFSSVFVNIKSDFDSCSKERYSALQKFKDFSTKCHEVKIKIFAEIKNKGSKFDDVKSEISKLSSECQDVCSFVDLIIKKDSNIISVYKKKLVDELKGINLHLKVLEEKELYKGLLKKYDEVLAQEKAQSEAVAKNEESLTLPSEEPRQLVTNQTEEVLGGFISLSLGDDSSKLVTGDHIEL